MSKADFIEKFKSRTKKLAVEIILFYADLPKTDALRIIGKQLIRSVTSTAANYRAACIARSSREFYSKISIVIEEADETLFWLELLEETKFASSARINFFKNEALEIVKVVSVARKNLKKDN